MSSPMQSIDSEIRKDSAGAKTGVRSQSRQGRASKKLQVLAPHDYET